jgi:hypothetical protein
VGRDRADYEIKEKKGKKREKHAEREGGGERETNKGTYRKKSTIE